MVIVDVYMAIWHHLQEVSEPHKNYMHTVYIDHVETESSKAWITQNRNKKGKLTKIMKRCSDEKHKKEHTET